MAVHEEITRWLTAQARERGEGALMPTVAEVSQRFGVGGVQTVRNGYAPLVRAGYVEVVQRPQRRWRVAQVPPTTSGVEELQMAVAELSGALEGAAMRLARVESALAALDSPDQP